MPNTNDESQHSVFSQWDDGEEVMLMERKAREECKLTKEDVIKNIIQILSDARADGDHVIKKYYKYRSLLAKHVGWGALNPHFLESEDYEAVMTRMVRIIDWDDGYGRTLKHETSALWSATSN